MSSHDNDECETCGNSGHIWRKGPDGKEWMYDCDNDDCNAFGQFDEFDENEIEEETL